MPAEEIWGVNKKFLEQQVTQGKRILFFHDPSKVRKESFFEREVNLLRRLGYEFQQKGQWTWEAVRNAQ